MRIGAGARPSGLARLAACVALVACAAFAPGARASTLNAAPDSGSATLYSGSQLVTGSAATVTPLQLSGAGTLSFALVDMSFPAALGSLLFSINDGNAALATWTGPGTMSLDITGPVTLYADVFATAQGTAMVGLYNLQVSFAPATPVPLPASGAVLGAALGLAALLRGHFRRRTYGCHTPHAVMAA